MLFPGSQFPPQISISCFPRVFAVSLNLSIFFSVATKANVNLWISFIVCFMFIQYIFPIKMQAVLSAYSMENDALANH